MISNFKLEIITPEKTIFTSEVDQVTIPSYEGEMTILKDHIALVTFLRPGILKIGEKDLENFYLSYNEHLSLIEKMLKYYSNHIPNFNHEILMSVYSELL